MKRVTKILLLLACLSATLAYTQTTFQHIIVVVQENRTPDNLFQGLCASPYGTCPSPYNISPNGFVILPPGTSGTQVALTPDTLPDDLDPDHGNKSFVQMYNSGGVNAGPTHVGCTTSPYCCPNNASECMINGSWVFNWLHYVENDNFEYNGKFYNRLDPYLAVATQYGWANYFFQTNQGPSFPAHQFLLSGTSTTTAPPNTLFAADNPYGAGNDFDNTGCTSPNGEVVKLIDGNGNENTNSPVYPCFEHATLTDLLDNAGHSWKWYANTSGSIWTAPNAIHHICNPIAGNTCNGQDWVKNVAPYVGPLGPGMVLTDLGVNGTSHTACQLAAVSWVTPDGGWSDHGGIGGAGLGFGPSWVADIVNAVGGVYYDTSGTKHTTPCPEYWGNTAVLIVWDDWGGWYDHVLPAPNPGVWFDNAQGICPAPSNWGCGYIYGFRVPFMFVSAHTPQQFVSGTVNSQNTTACTDIQHCYDFGSILQFIESNFGLTTVVQQPYAYADTVAKPLDPQFYSLSTARTFTPIPAPVPAICFINPNTHNCYLNYTGPLDPDDDASD